MNMLTLSLSGYDITDFDKGGLFAIQVTMSWGRPLLSDHFMLSLRKIRTFSFSGKLLYDPDMMGWELQ